MYKCALILAAGQGTRIKSDLLKVLHKVCRKEMVNHVIDTLRKADINVIIGKESELVKEKTSSKEVSYSLQTEQLVATLVGSSFGRTLNDQEITKYKLLD